METVSFLAQLWGFSIILVSLALLINPREIDHLWKLMEDRGTMFLWGTITLVIGIASILTYNVWDDSWHMIITLLGWATVVKGAATMFVPDYVKNMYAKFRAKKDGMLFALAAVVILGCVLLYFGFII